MRNKFNLNTSSTEFHLPPKGILNANHITDDPLRFYYYPFIGRFYRGRIKQALSLLSGPYENTLEIGYGSGILFPTLSLISKKISGIDLKQPPLELKSNLSKIGVNKIPDLYTGDIASCEFSDNQFDLIIAISIFEHVKDPSNMLREIHRILRRGGSLLVGMPRVDSSMDALFKLIGFPNIGDHHVTTHRQFITYAQRLFELMKLKKYAPLGLNIFPLYYSMLFRKLT